MGKEEKVAVVKKPNSVKRRREVERTTITSVKRREVDLKVMEKKVKVIDQKERDHQKERNHQKERDHHQWMMMKMKMTTTSKVKVEKVKVKEKEKVKEKKVMMKKTTTSKVK